MKDNQQIIDKTLQAIMDRTNKKTNVDFIRRFQDPNRDYIRLPDSNVATHRLGYTNTPKYDIVFPMVQNIDSKLKNFGNDWRSAIKSAISRNDTIHVPPGYGEIYTSRYKEFYPNFKYENK